MEVDPREAYSSLEYEGKEIYFCSKFCEEGFKKNPEKYLK